MTSPHVRIEDLRVAYPARARNAPVVALDGVSLDLAEGQLTCLIGPSGCGKTTLLRVLAGLETATSGSATIHQRDGDHPAKGMVFQGAGLFPWLTVEENVAYGLQMRGVLKSERRAIARRWIGEVGLERFTTAYPAQLSGGMQQRVGLARAFAYDPDVLLMDEPFGALDAQTRLLLQELLLRQWERHERTVLFVTHSIEEALTIADRIVVMSARPGRILRDITVPFARPRDAVALRGDGRFSALFAEIWELLRGEVERSTALETRP